MCPLAGKDQVRGARGVVSADPGRGVRGGSGRDAHPVGQLGRLGAVLA